MSWPAQPACRCWHSSRSSLEQAGVLTKGCAILLLHSDIGRQAVGSSKEGVEAASEVDQRAGDGATSLAGEQSMALLIQGHFLQEGAGALCQVGLAGTNGHRASQVQVVNEAKPAGRHSPLPCALLLWGAGVSMQTALRAHTPSGLLLTAAQVFFKDRS